MHPQANRGQALEELVENVFRVSGPRVKMFHQAILWVPIQNGKTFPRRGAPIDFIGVMDGIPVAVECKETSTGRLPLNPSRFPEKQVAALREFEEAGGKSFVVAAYWKKNILAVFEFPDFQKLWLLYKKGEIKSLSIDNANVTIPIQKSLKLSDILLKSA